ncbi:hypothetical protein PQX77_008443 [Marasmius sp. AFHP31]|nr:hypothetical protein PQX77_008443 [Marasmius sp. AFHP31]
MSDLASVRAEIKAWERSFKDENDRLPSVDDIRRNSSIANKYRLYKKLTKTSQQAAIPKSRPTQQTAPLSSFNPFSPTKNKGKLPESPLRSRTSRPNNPFTTPSKSIAKLRVRESSPSPAPQTRPATSTSASATTVNLSIAPSNALPDPPSAVVRARKRLRGEPVSPSPNKDKRRRVHSSQQSILAFARRRDSGSSSSDDEGDIGEGKTGSSFIDDSPMKKRPGGKSFQTLFEDVGTVRTSNTRLQSALERAKSSNSSTGFFGRPAKDASSISFDDEMDWEMGDETSVGREKAESRLKPVNGKQRLKRWAPTKDNLHAADPSTSNPEPSKAENVGKKPAKRVTMSDASDEEPGEGVNRSRSTSAKPTVSLLPPSPPPADTSSSHNSRSSGSALMNSKAKANRKKAKLSAKDREDYEDGDSSASEGNANIKVRLRSFTRGVTPAIGEVGDMDVKMEGGDNEATGGVDVDLDPDPILRYFRPPQRVNGGGFTSFISSEGEDDLGDSDDHFTEPGLDDTRTQPGQPKKRGDTRDGGLLEIDLPDQMKHFLALSASEIHARDDRLREEMVVESLLYGRRAGHYDGSRGGEIWDVGDVSGPEEGDGGELVGSRHKHAEPDGEEDDWEGEPVPWEIGEL